MSNVIVMMLVQFRVFFMLYVFVNGRKWPNNCFLDTELRIDWATVDRVTY